MQAIERLRAPYQQERTLLARLITTLPPPGTTRESPPSRLEPAMILIEGYTPKSEYLPNTEVLSVETASRPDEPSSGRATFQPHLGYRLDHCLAWTGPNNPLADSASGDRGRLGRDCESALAAPYLVVTRVLEESLPERLLFEAFVIRHRQEQIAGAFVIDLRRAPPKADGTTVGPQPTDEAGIRSAFHEAGRCALLGRLARIDGSTIRSNARCSAATFTTEVGPTLRRASPP